MSDTEKTSPTKKQIRAAAAEYLLAQFKGFSNTRETAETVQRIQTAFTIVFTTPDN
jgi:hypothetical protein